MFFDDSLLGVEITHKNDVWNKGVRFLDNDMRDILFIKVYPFVQEMLQLYKELYRSYQLQSTSVHILLTKLMKPTQLRLARHLK